MGYGSKLKDLLDERGMSTRQLAKAAGIAPTTLYTIIQRDTNIRYDMAIRIANVLDVPIASICDNIPYDPANTLPNLPNTFADSNPDFYKKAYFSNRTLEIAKLFNYEEFPTLDRLIASFYVLDDNARQEILDLMEMKHGKYDDPDRVEKLKTI